jgi:hypothetical protein
MRRGSKSFEKGEPKWNRSRFSNNGTNEKLLNKGSKDQRS